MSLDDDYVEPSEVSIDNNSFSMLEGIREATVR